MPNPDSIASLFEKEPSRWGLRGDPHLWREMRQHFEKIPRPATVEGLEALVAAMFESLTGHLLKETQPFFVERFSHGGMSSGHVSPDFWRNEAIPLLRARFEES